MITNAIVCSRQKAKEIVSGLLKTQTNVCWVTIANLNAQPLVRGKHKNILSMKFDDVISPIKGINPSQVRKLKNFLFNHHFNAPKTKPNWTCVINCHAGISRSAAIGMFLKETLDVNVTFIECPFPNSRVARLLGASALC